MNRSALIIKLSFHKLSEEERSAKLQEAFTEIGDGMAKLALEGSDLTKDLDATAAGFFALAVAFEVANDVLKSIGQTAFAKGRGGAADAADLASRFGGVEQLGAAGEAFNRLFVPESEQMETPAQRD